MNYIWPFLLRLEEVFFILLLFRYLPTRFAGRWPRILLPVLLAAVLTAARMLIDLGGLETEYIFMTFLYYPIILLFLFLYYRVKPIYCIYCLLLVFLTFYSLRVCIVALSARILGADFLTFWHPEAPFRNLLILGLYSACQYATVRVVRNAVKENYSYELKWSHLAVMAIAILPVLYIGNLGVWTGLDQLALPMAAFIVGLVTSFGGLIVVINYQRALALGEKNAELSRMEALLAAQSQQYALQKDTVELLNLRTHDLKNQLNYLASDPGEKDRQVYMDELRAELDTYAAVQQTGSEALDVVLTAKSLTCAEKKIQLLAFLDGSRLLFLRPLDVSAIFSNALDNAIRAVENLPEDQREIDVRMSETKDWISLSFENPYKGTLSQNEDGTLRSDKTEEGPHGLGLRSIEHTIARYQGHMTYTAENGQFSLCLLFPRGQEEQN